MAMVTATGEHDGPSPPERLAARAGRVAREDAYFVDLRLLRALRRVRRAIKADRRTCPDDPHRRTSGVILWCPKSWWCEQFYHLIRRERLSKTLEVGTSLGMTSLYVLAALARNSTSQPPCPPNSTNSR